jgi:hypothetical protein
MDLNTRNDSKRSNAKLNHYIIISERNDSTDWPSRESVRDAIFDIYPDSIQKLIVAKEDLNAGKDVVFKILIKFEKNGEHPQGITSVSIKKSLNERGFFVNKQWVFDTETARNIKVAVTECTKFDFDCVHDGHNRDRFHPLWKEENLCVRHMGKEWNPSHPVVADTAAKGKASLDSLRKRWQRSETNKIELIKRRKIVNNFKNWQGEFVDSWNDAIDQIELGFLPKQFYIYGDSGCFKTSFIQHVLGRLSIHIKILLY